MFTSMFLSSRKALFGAAALAVLAGCQQGASVNNQEITADNLVVSGDTSVQRTIGEGKSTYQVFGKTAVAKLVQNKKVHLSGSLEATTALKALSSGETNGDAPADTVTPPAPAPSPDTSLVLGFPITMLGEHQLFGGVVTGTSAKASEDLGRLKLTDLPPLHVRPSLLRVSDTEYVLALMGCVNACSEASPQQPLITIPVLGVNEEETTLFLDLASLGSELNLIQMLDPDGAYTKLKTKTSKTVSFDYSLKTLVFDVEVRMIPLEADVAATDVAETTFTIRWYMRLSSAFNPAFESRPATEGVGFFMTERSASPRVTRFSRFVQAGVTEQTGSVRYYIKNVPEKFQPAFKASFDEWNTKFKEVTGAPLLSYEFVAAEDPRSKLLVAGDIRYNIVEWDLDNLAPYGGLGPSIANQFSGETMSANVLVQGPKIVQLYTKWFETAKQVNDLREIGHNAEADRLMARTMRDIKALIPGSQVEKPFAMKLGRLLDFRINSQLPQLSDPLFARDDFEEIPAGQDFEGYMQGYFQELVSHEVGHNVGLRHNFRGNLSATTDLTVGGVSHSIMEYLGRGFRHLNRISTYDVMAIAYGYLGTAPAKKNLFCTDEDVADAANLAGSPECSRDDATSDPFRFFEARLTRVTDLLIARGQKEAPTWTLSDLETQLKQAVSGIALYAARAELNGDKWTNFFTGGDRPTSPVEVKAYALAKVKGKICDASFGEVVAFKETAEAKATTIANIKALQDKVATLLAPLTEGATAILECTL